MTIWQIIGRLIPFVKPYKFLIALLLILTLIGAVAAQVNALVLRYTVDTIQVLVDAGSRDLTLFLKPVSIYRNLFLIRVCLRSSAAETS